MRYIEAFFFLCQPDNGESCPWYCLQYSSILKIDLSVCKYISLTQHTGCRRILANLFLTSQISALSPSKHQHVRTEKRILHSQEAVAEAGE